MTHLRDSDPVEYLRRRPEMFRPYMLFSEFQTDHAVNGGNGEVSRSGGRERPQFDHLWTCWICHPYKEAKEGKRIVEAFERHEMWMELIVGRAAADREQERIRKKTKYVAIPIGLDEFVFMTTGRTHDAYVQIPDIDAFVFEVLMPQRWGDDERIRPSQKFLPPDREYKYIECKHPATRRRCWETHEDTDESDLCPVPEMLDGSRDGWVSRGTNGWYKIGKFRVRGTDLWILAKSLDIKAWYRRAKEDVDAVWVFFEPMNWNDPRFVKLRIEAGWTPPNVTFQPPPFTMTYGVNDRGLLVIDREETA